MDYIIILTSILYILYLFYEAYQNDKNRRKIKHLIHVNGTRGKSSTSRLMEAGLRSGEHKIFCKTTGTRPMIIDVDGVERSIIRKSRPNIKEQIKVLKQAAKQQADIAIIECMAVKPELQHITQNKILKADISIVTNVRRDHLEEMGPTLENVAIALGNVMPQNGYFIIGEEKFLDYYTELGRQRNTKVLLAEKLDEDLGIDFKENVEIALEICKLFGVDKKSALERMKKYKKDPGVLKIYQISTKGKNIVQFINGFAINDPDSIKIIYNELRAQGVFENKELILLVNNRRDRPYRVKQHIEIVEYIKPDKVWITGDYKGLMRKYICRKGFDKEKIRVISKIDNMNVDYLEKNSVIFAIGNIVGNGERILKYIEEIGDAVV